jgi:hypothetical protein
MALPAGMDLTDRPTLKFRKIQMLTITQPGTAQVVGGQDQSKVKADDRG